MPSAGKKNVCNIFPPIKSKYFPEMNDNYCTCHTFAESKNEDYKKENTHFLVRFSRTGLQIENPLTWENAHFLRKASVHEYDKIIQVSLESSLFNTSYLPDTFCASLRPCRHVRPRAIFLCLHRDWADPHTVKLPNGKICRWRNPHAFCIWMKYVLTAANYPCLCYETFGH